MPLVVRAVERADFAQWLPLWRGYCALGGRPADPTVSADGLLSSPVIFPALSSADAITMTTWSWFFDVAEPVHCLVAASDGRLLGLAHYIFHRNTGSIEPVCYLQDLFTDEAARGSGVGRALIEGVYAAAKAANSPRVYWQTQHSNAVAIQLYDKIAVQLAVHVYRKELATVFPTPH